MPSSQGRAPSSNHTHSTGGTPPLLPTLVCTTIILCSSFLQLCDTTVMDTVDLLESLYLHNTTFAGLQQKPGPHSEHPAAYFSGSARAVYYSHRSRDRAASLIQASKEFTFLTSIRQHRLNTGTIFSFSYGKYQTNRYLEIQSSGRQNMLRIHYSPSSVSQVWTTHHPGTPDTQVRVESFPLRLADDSWHKLAVVVSGDQIEVLLDCRSVHRRVVPPLDTSFSLSEDLVKQEGNLTLWLGQRSMANSLFQGYLQQPRLVAGHHGYLTQCPHSDSLCPTCGQFQQLEETVSQLQLYIKQLTARLDTAESRLSQLENCECVVSCLVQGDTREDGETWDTEDCRHCICQGGEVLCEPVQCSKADCVSPSPPGPGQCCPYCDASCDPFEKLTPHLTHGETFVAARCYVCKCWAGSVTCQQESEESCPRLECPVEEQIRQDGHCCPICREYDFCSHGHDCHKWARCTNGIFNYSCHCNQGFQGNGTHCDDVDECKQTGGMNGHHCPLENGRCINQEGGYTCECIQGYALDTTNTRCLPVSVCKTGQHTCHRDAVCTDTGGHHSCRCKPGYLGDGHHCTPECRVPCQNGGSCSFPGSCTCPPGYTGTYCQDDIDECSLGAAVHQCGEDSICINRPGWFYCACRQGFASYRNPVTQVTSCTDVDECEDRSHTCHNSATCLNTVGSYTCDCQYSDNPQCSTSCVLEGVEHDDGSSWVDGCNQCQCNSGRVECHQIDCDCSQSNTDRDCCYECYDTMVCSHQSIPGVHYSSGHRWSYNCMECECMHGEVDCWPRDCPTLTCSHPVTTPGLCCPQCSDQRQDGDCNQGTNTSCGLQVGLARQEGDSWSLDFPPCTSCLCKAGSIYCSADPSCHPDLAHNPVSLLPVSLEQENTKDFRDDSSESFLEQIEPPESGHDLLSKEIIDEAFRSKLDRSPRRRRRIRKGFRRHKNPFKLSDDFVHAYTSTPSTKTPLHTQPTLGQV